MLIDDLNLEITAAYNLLIYLVQQCATPGIFLSRVCQYLSKPITSSPANGSTIALSILTTIFNTLSAEDESQYHVFMAIVAVIRSSNSTSAYESLKEQLSTQLPQWLDAWELDEEDAQKLHRAIADAATEAGDSEFAFTHILLALQTISPAEASSDESRKLAVEALTSALTNPTVFDFTPLTTSDAIQALRKSDSALFELLEIFAADTLDTYEEFTSSNPLSSIPSLPENASEVLTYKIRVLTLASLAANTPSRSLPYTVIAEALRIPASDVEKWVIDSIRAGLVEGKLSQLRGEFLVQRATYRVFTEKQWSEVQGRLMVWKRSLEGVLSVIKSERERVEKATAAQAAAAIEGTEEGRGGFNKEKRRGGFRNNQAAERTMDQGPKEVEASEA